MMITTTTYTTMPFHHGITCRISLTYINVSVNYDYIMVFISVLHAVINMISHLPLNSL